MGTVGGPKGLVEATGNPYPRYGRVRFNGGHSAPNGRLYDGYDNPWPELAEGYAWYTVSTWGVCCLPDTTPEINGTKKMKLNKRGYQTR